MAPTPVPAKTQAGSCPHVPMSPYPNVPTSLCPSFCSPSAAHPHCRAEGNICSYAMAVFSAFIRAEKPGPLLILRDVALVGACPGDPAAPPAPPALMYLPCSICQSRRYPWCFLFPAYSCHPASSQFFFSPHVAECHLLRDTHISSSVNHRQPESERGRGASSCLQQIASGCGDSAGTLA